MTVSRKVLGIGVVGAQEEPAPMGPGEEPVDQRLSGVSHMQKPRRARRETDGDGHWKSRWSAGRAPVDRRRPYSAACCAFFGRYTPTKALVIG